MPNFKRIHIIFPKKILKTFLRITFLIILFIFLSFITNQNNVNASGICDFLCEIGIKYYNNANYLDAFHEFKKVLILEPDNEIAKEYIKLIKEELNLEAEPSYPPLTIMPQKEKTEVIEKSLDEFEKALKGLTIPQKAKRPTIETLERLAESKGISPEISKTPEGIIKIKPPEAQEKPYTRLSLDETVKATQPQTKLELQIERDLFIKGKNISRFLVINPEILEIEKKSPDEVLIIAKKIGSTYLHIWDDEGRWTFIAYVSPFRSGRPTLAELYRRRIEEAESFRLSYSNEWYSFNTGRRLDDTQRQSLSFYQSLGLDGQTPYGDVDSRVQFNKLKDKTELTYYTLGLEDGMLGSFKGFDVRLFDYYIDFHNLSFGGSSLRGVRFDSEAFNETVNYTTFWGRENQGVFSPLAPGLVESKDSFIEGGRLGLSLPKNIYQTFSYFRGYGSARNPIFSKDAYDYTGEIRFGNTTGLRTDVAHDGNTIAYLLSSTYTIPKFKLTTEFRNIEDEFIGITGRPYASGELGALFSYTYNPNSRLRISGRLDTYRDRLFPNPEHQSRYNIYFNSDLNYKLDPTTSLRLDYYNTHYSGVISPHKDEAIGVSVYKTLDFIRKLNTYLSFRHQASKNPTSTSLDYKNEKLSVGVRFALTEHLHYFASKEFNWLKDYTGDMYRPHAFETGLDHNTQFFNTPFYITSRLYFRDEEDATATRSFLAGEDKLEARGELRYQPSEDFSSYVNLRLNNIWAENPDVSKRLDAEVRLGTRWNFDTGFRWSPVGSIAGIVFKDLNSDGIYQINEPSIKDIKILLGEEKYDITDDEGMFFFENVRAKKAILSIDTNTLASGFVLTGPSLIEVTIEHGRIVNVYFGVTSRCEIYGIVFNDVNGNSKFDSEDIGIADAILTLEDKTKAITNEKGQYYLRGISAGEHTITLDINSLPVNLIPQVALFKKIELFEGMTYIHNIPLKEVEK